MEGVSHTSKESIPPKPPDGKASTKKISFRDKLMGDKVPPPRREQGGHTGNDNTHANPSSKQESVINAKENLHGDWIAVSRLRKENKYRGKDLKTTNKEAEGGTSKKVAEKGKKSLESGNRYSSLFQKIENDAVPIFSAEKSSPNASIGSGSHKMLTRKKRPRKEPTLVQPKIFKDVNSKPISKPEMKATEPTETNTKTVVEPSVPSVEEDRTHIASTGPDRIKSFPGQIQTSLDVVYIEPNKLRFVDEPKPPDPILQMASQAADSNLIIDSMDEVQFEDCGDDQEMVADTYKN
ncbi:hypothetical protein SESBI_22093 [Sesbania bispinosa]|nr:hypothetical protein SESBI_22093 [Sesbania bispinosa]